MTRLPVADFRTKEKVLLRIGFEAMRRKGSHVFYDIPMEEQRPYPIIMAETYHVLLVARY